MRNIERYYKNTENELPHDNIKQFIKMELQTGNAIELGCGAGRDTIYLIKNNWNVLAIDRENTEERISKKLDKKELLKFRFQRQDFEDIILEKNNLIVANFSLPFCKKDNFNELWSKITNSILPNRIFCGEFFWNK